MTGTAYRPGVGANGYGTTGGTKSPCAPPARADFINPRVDTAGAKADNRNEANKGASIGALSKVFSGVDKELLRSE